MGYVACCPDHLSTFALVLFDDQETLKRNGKSIMSSVFACVFILVIGVLACLLEWKKKLIFHSKKEVAVVS